MNLGQLLKSAGKEFQEIKIKGISFDSRKIKKGDIFFAIKGNKTSGVKFIHNAILNVTSACGLDETETSPYVEDFSSAAVGYCTFWSAPLISTFELSLSPTSKRTSKTFGTGRSRNG